MAIAFINYRRSDTQQAAQALYAQLRTRFGPTRVFLDVGAILPGAIWPNRLREALTEATVILSIIGPRWLTAANEYGQRRLDDPNDWVRNELVFAITNEKPIVTILVAGAESLPPPQALPADIQDLLNHQSMNLRDEKWDRDLDELIEVLKSEYGFIDIQTPVVMPMPQKAVVPLTAIELDEALQNLAGWVSVESIDPQHYPRPRQELRKVYQFKSFRAAIAFMNTALPIINSLQHHPRWENQWKTVTVYITTWDIGSRISELDIQLASALDSLYFKST